MKGRSVYKEMTVTGRKRKRLEKESKNSWGTPCGGKPALLALRREKDSKKQVCRGNTIEFPGNLFEGRAPDGGVNCPTVL